MKNFGGVGVALVTPFNENKEVDYDALSKLVNHVIEGGVDYVVALGTTAETATLSRAEKISVLQHIITSNNGRVKTVVGVGGNNTAEVISDLKQFCIAGVDAILSVSPYYNKPTQAGIYAHFDAIAQACTLPIIVYNVPGRTASNILPSTLKKLYTTHQHIIAVKEASGNLQQNMEIIAELERDDFAVLSGDDNLTLAQLACGMDGVISVAANCFTAEFCAMVKAAMAGNFTEARKYHYALFSGIDLLFTEGNPAGVKCFLSKMHICKNELRLPLVAVSQETESKVADFLKSRGNKA